MKEVRIKNIEEWKVEQPVDRITKVALALGENLEVSDGYHTFDELYEQRARIYITLCRFYKSVDLAEWGRDQVDVWRSKTHSDGSSYDGWFLLGMGKEKGKQLTYHLPDSYWDETEFAETLDLAPEFDGHTPADVLERLKAILRRVPRTRSCVSARTPPPRTALS